MSKLKISPKRYIQGFLIIVLTLGWARELSPSLSYNADQKASADSLATVVKDSLDRVQAYNDSIAEIERLKAEMRKPQAVENTDEKAENSVSADNRKVVELKNEPGFVPHRLYSVWGNRGGSFKVAFPDDNETQLVAAKKNGVEIVKSREDAELRKDELVYVGSNPYYFVDDLNNSVPYLVPKAAVLMQDIGKAFFDSLQVKGFPLQKLVVTSVLRSQEDVAKLQRRNQNATTQSCHQYGTTVDIAYNRYKVVADPEGDARRAVSNDTLKWILSEVLYDMRQQGRCFVKHEVKQGCFHLTVR